MASPSTTAVLRLVGLLYQGSPNGVVPWLRKAFPALAELVGRPCVVRQIQYASGSTDNDHLRFIAIDAAATKTVPKEMMCWEIAHDRWTILRGDGVLVSRAPLSWTWLDTAVSSSPCGEFRASCPADWLAAGQSSLREFRMVSNSYIGVPCDDEIRLVDYDPSWPMAYERIRQDIAAALGPTVLNIEHFGSTSIPGTAAKPVIDVLVEVSSFDAARARVIPALNKPHIEYWSSDHLKFYCRDRKTGVRTHHIHVAPASHPIWEGIRFRDYMRCHPEEAARYVALKYALAEQYADDRLAYTEGKTDFVRDILRECPHVL